MNTVISILGIGFGLVFCALWIRERMRLRQVRELLSRLSRHSSSIFGAAEQTASSSRDLAESSSAQLDRFHSTASASDEISSMVARTSDTAQHLSNDSQELADIASQGKTVVASLMDASEKIRTQNQTFHSEMQQRSEQLKEVVKVIGQIAEKTKVINDIVFQTKILSFNASVEAARAGEHGKGFAVVAEEVGNLAAMSGKAASEIGQILDRGVSVTNTIVEQISSTVGSLTKESSKVIEHSYQTAQDCERLFSDVASRVDALKVSVDAISSASSEQSKGVADINQALLHLNQLAERNDLAAHQSLRLGEELDREARGLISVESSLLSLIGTRSDMSDTSIEEFIWTDRFVLGVGEMDDEHQLLVKKINALVRALKSPAKDLAEINKAFGEMAAYVVVHFADEELYMESISYPQLESHRMIHKKLLAQAGEFGEALKRGELDSRKLVAFLRNWLVSHIMGVDMQYSVHAKGQSKKIRHPSPNEFKKAA